VLTWLTLGSLPAPPALTGVNTGGQWTETVAVAVALIAIAVAAYRLGRRYRTWVPLIIPLGALIAGFMEPLYDVATNLWYFKPGQVSLLSSFGGNLPLWVLFSYCAAYGGLGLTVWWMIQRGTSRRQLWAATGGMWVGFVLLEICNLALGTYTYYGPQPFRLGRFPAWVSLANAAVCIALGVVMTVGGQALKGRSQWLLLIAVPGVVAMGLFGTTFPEDLALHVADASRALVYGAALASTLLALALVGLAIALFGVTHPSAGSQEIEPAATVSKGRRAAPTRSEADSATTSIGV
jgi:hypothetical protein